MSEYYRYALEKCLKSVETDSSSITNESALCLSMCPPEETQKRISNTHGRDFTIAEQQDRIHVLEGADPSIIDEFTRVPIKQENLLVKVYARSNDQETKQPSILRPPHVLEKTVIHLIHYCLRVGGTNDPRLPDRAVTFSDVYAFVHDRFKMVHRDAIWQGTSAYNQIDVLIRIHEMMCRFLILFTHYCYGETDFLSSRDKSLDKWFAELIDLYNLAVENEQFENCCHCGEFLGYYVIYFYSLRQRAKDDHITFTSNLSKAQLILSTVLPHLSEADRSRNASLFSDALDMIAQMESFNCTKLYATFEKASPLLVILLFYGNIGLLRLNSCKRLWLLSKTEVSGMDLEKVLFCDKEEIQPILKKCNITYNPETNTFKRGDVFAHTIHHYERPVSFIQQKIKYFSLEDIVFGASAEYPLQLPPSSLTFQTVLYQPLAPDAVRLFDMRDDRALPTYFSKEVDMVPTNEGSLFSPAKEVPPIFSTETPTNASLFSPVKETGFLFSKETPTNASLFSPVKETGLHFSTETPMNPSLFSPVKETPSISETPLLFSKETPTSETPSCLWNDSNIQSIHTSSLFSSLASQSKIRSPFTQFSFSECTEEEEELEEDQDTYLFSSTLSEVDMKLLIQKKEEEEEKQKRREEEERRKREEEEKERKRREEEERIRIEQEKKENEAKEHSKKLQAIVNEYKNGVNQVDEKIKSFEQSTETRLSEIGKRVSSLLKHVRDVQVQAEEWKIRKEKKLKQYRLDYGEKFCHIFGNVESYFETHYSLKRPYQLTISTRKHLKVTRKCSLLPKLPIHENVQFRISFGSDQGINNTKFTSFMSHFEQNGKPLKSGFCGFSIQNEHYYSISVYVEDPPKPSNVSFFYHRIDSQSAIKSLRGGSHIIECVDCPCWLIPRLQKEYAGIEHVVYLSAPSAVDDLEMHYKSILQNQIEKRFFSITLGELLWKLIVYSALPVQTINSMKSVLLSNCFELVNKQCKPILLNKIKQEISQSVVHLASLYQYCFESDHMQQMVTVDPSSVENVIQMIKKSIPIVNRVEDTKDKPIVHSKPNRIEALRREMYKEIIEYSTFLTQLKEMVIETDDPSIVINENELLF